MKSDASPWHTLPFIRLGLLDYLEAWVLQKAIAQQRREGFLPDTLLLLEHPHTYTLGRRGKRSDVLLEDEALEELGLSVCRVDRGGEVTYHGPGQLVAYPIVDLRPLGGPVKYVRTLEAVIIATLRDFGLDARRGAGLAGVWVGSEKIAAIGVKVSRGITTHGLALNVNPDLSFFRHIVPCGIPGGGVTSMERLLGERVPLEQVALGLVCHFGLRLHRPTVEVAPEWLWGRVCPAPTLLVGGS